MNVIQINTTWDSVLYPLNWQKLRILSVLSVGENVDQHSPYIAEESMNWYNHSGKQAGIFLWIWIPYIISISFPFSLYMSPRKILAHVHRRQESCSSTVCKCKKNGNCCNSHQPREWMNKLWHMHTMTLIEQ